MTSGAGRPGDGPDLRRARGHRGEGGATVGADPATYARLALDQIPRLLGNLDRNPHSPTYGCFHRDYWLDKTSDFPDAVRQFAVHALALVYARDFPGNPFRGEPKVLDWTVAALDFWAGIQHRDGSFDEFYPWERGWVGPTGFTLYAATETLLLLGDEVPEPTAERVRAAIRKAARFVAAGESEEDHLANHHAMACLAVWKAWELTGEPELREGFERRWSRFLDYHRAEEGWSREYDGIDPGYLSATVSFLAKMWRSSGDDRLLEVLAASAGTCAYFVYPNGFYAGSIGSRNTLHFYPHGFELLARELPAAAAVAERTLRSLEEGKLVPPGIMSDRYVVYRVPEFLLAYLDHAPRTEPPPLPAERDRLRVHLPRAGIWVRAEGRLYAVANLAKGGVLKAFDRRAGRLALNDCGFVGRTAEGRLVTSQWIDPGHGREVTREGWRVDGTFHRVPTAKVFSPFKSLLFRAALLAGGWIPAFSHWLKGRIRRALMLGTRPVPIRFRRRVRVREGTLTVEDRVRITGDVRLERLAVGGEFFLRYVPQSQYFQSQELDTRSWEIGEEDLERLNAGAALTVHRTLRLPSDGEPPPVVRSAEEEHEGEEGAVPKGVYTAEYHRGRQSKRQLAYRLRRRTAEVAAALERHRDRELRVILDVGTADGLMLAALRERHPDGLLLGLEMSRELLEAAAIEGIHKCQADGLRMPVRRGAADAVIATAVVEHVPDPARLLRECAGSLRPGGLLVVTTPDPRMERLASALGILKDAGHHTTFDLEGLRTLMESSGFRVLETRKFMFSPVGFPAEKTIERILGPLGLHRIMANQLAVGRRA